MIIKLKEAYNNEWPEWVKKYINTKNGKGYSVGDTLLQKNIDIANVTVHTDFRKEYLKDPNKVCFIHFDFGRYSKVLVISGADVINEVEEYIGDRWSKFSKKSAKWISENMSGFCWIDKLETDRRSINKDKRMAAADYPRKSKGQYIRKQDRHNDDGSLAIDEFGDYIEDDVWTSYGKYDANYDPQIGKRYGYNRYDRPVMKDTDKSGYPLDPDKYLRILNHVGKDNYAKQIERFYNQTKEAVDCCRALEDKTFSPADFNDQTKRITDDDFSWVSSYKRELIKNYNTVVKKIKYALNEEQKNQGREEYDPEGYARMEEHLWDSVEDAAQTFKNTYKKFKEYRDLAEKFIASKEGQPEDNYWRG